MLSWQESLSRLPADPIAKTSTPRPDANANTAQPFFCLQKKAGRPAVATMTSLDEPAVLSATRCRPVWMQTQTLLNCRFVYRKNGMRRSLPQRQSVTASIDEAPGKGRRSTAESVERLVRLPKRTASHVMQAEKRLDCGKTPAYPQDGMCRTHALYASRFFVQHRRSVDTGLFQHIGIGVNR